MDSAVPSSPFIWEYRYIRRFCRVGACPVLEVRVTYPQLAPAEGEGNASRARFNQCYARLAEVWLAWALTSPAAEAAEAFCALGPEAPYRYDRALLLCVMTVTWEEGLLTVTRTLTVTTRRTAEGGAPPPLRVEVDRWRIPSLTLVGGKGFGRGPVSEKKTKKKALPKTDP